MEMINNNSKITLIQNLFSKQINFKSLDCKLDLSLQSSECREFIESLRQSNVKIITNELFNLILDKDLWGKCFYV
jgi:hypothetical protein